MPLVPAFQLRLKDQILEGLATVGKYDGKHPCLTAATSGGKIFMHNPYQQEADGSNVKYLNINKKISAVSHGELDPTSGRDVLLVGTKTDLLAYDVDENRDHFFKDVPDGVNAMLCGRLGQRDTPMAVVGGNCSIQGFDMNGEELYWTVTGDNVNAMALADINGDGRNELLVGSDDFEIRVFQNEEVVSEVTEAERVVGLAPVQAQRFGYALCNGTVGVYDGTRRQWRVKSKNHVTAFCAYDLDGDGVPEVVSGWSSGKLEVRNEHSGELLYKDNFAGAVTALLRADYRKDGGEDMLCCSLDGEVRGYRAQENGAAGAGAGGTGGGEGGNSMMDGDANEEMLMQLNQRRQDMLIELKSYERNGQIVSGLGKKGATQNQTEMSGAIPRDTHVNSSLEMNPDIQAGELVLSTNNDTVIKAVVMFAEAVFEEEARFVSFPSPKSTVRIPIKPPRDVASELVIKALVSSRTSSVFHVFELEFKLPRFCMYVPVAANIPEPISSVTFRVPERAKRVAAWIDEAFMTNCGEGLSLHSDELSVAFVGLRDAKPLLIKVSGDGSGTQSAGVGGMMTIRTDNLETAGDFVQELCAGLGIAELESTADFPYDMEAFRDVLVKVDEHNAVRLRLTADVADSSNAVKAFVIKAEDARILTDMNLMRRMYGELFDLNRELIMEHTKRATNHADLLAALKEVNQMIQKAARLRMGTAKTRIITACRQAIKENNIQDLFKILNFGSTK